MDLDDGLSKIVISDLPPSLTALSLSGYNLEFPELSTLVNLRSLYSKKESGLLESVCSKLVSLKA